MADEEIELCSFSPSSLTVPTDDHATMSGSHGHFGQTGIMRSHESKSHVYTASAVTAGTVIDQLAHRETSLDSVSQIPCLTHNIGALPVASASGRIGDRVTLAVIPPRRHLMTETHRGKPVSCAMIPPRRHMKTETHRGKPVSCAMIPPQHHTMAATHRGKPVNFAMIPPQHHTMAATHRGTSFTRAVITDLETACNTTDSPFDNKAMSYATYAGIACREANRGVHYVQPLEAKRAVHNVQPQETNSDVHNMQPQETNSGVPDVQPGKTKRGGSRPRTLVAVSVPHISTKYLNNKGSDDRCGKLQLEAGNNLDTLHLAAGNKRGGPRPGCDHVTLNDTGQLMAKDYEEEHNVNYSNYRKGSKRRLTLKPNVDPFEAGISAPSNLSGRNSRRLLRAATQNNSSGGPVSNTSPAALNIAAHNVTASTRDSDTSVVSGSPESPGDAESKTSSTSVDSADDAESKTSSTSVESSDDAERKSSSTSLESADDAERKSSSTSVESADDAERKSSSTSVESADDAERQTSSTSVESSEDAEGQTSSTSADNSTISDDSGSKDTLDMEEKETSSSSSTPSPDEGDKTQRKKRKKRKGFFTRLMKSAPEEQWLLKVVLWFPVGIGMSVALYFLVIQKMNLQEKYKLIIGCGLGLVLSLTFSFSVQMRCVMTLIVPTFVGKAGRSYFAAFAIVYLVNGPITNIMDNCKEIVRSMTCNSALTANHTRAKYKLRMQPVEHALGDLMKDNFLIVRASRMINKAFSPLTKEIKENEDENREMESSIKDVEKMGKKKDSVVDNINANYKDTNTEKDAGKKVEKQWEKKMDLRCQGTFSHGVQRCRDKMHQLESKCMDKLSFLGYLVCWPLKITVFCELVKLIPGVVGMDCNSANQVSPGFGETYVSARDVMDDMETGAKVNLQYKIVGSAEASYMPVEEMRQATMHEVKAKTDTINMTLNIITHFLTFTFLIVFYGAYKYNGNYLSDLNWDNKYITAYFRHIDARRKAREKRTLLPLKKAERKELYDPRKIKLSVAERKQLVKGSIKLVFRVIISAIICYMDSMFYQVLDIIARNSKIEYHQTGEHIVDIKIYGKGFMSALVRSFLERFNTKHNLDSLTTNYECLPRPSKTDMVIISFIFGTYMLVWMFMFFEAFGLRMRRAIAAFYYRKREKKRILYLYNERYRKRVGFLQHMRKKVRKQLREREFKRKIGLLLALKRQFPFLSKCLNVFKSAKDTCIICGETETKGFYTCPTEGCGVSYCRECWIDIKKKCYSCGQMSETEEDSDSDSETADDGDSSAEDSE